MRRSIAVHFATESLYLFLLVTFVMNTGARLYDEVDEVVATSGPITLRETSVGVVIGKAGVVKKVVEWVDRDLGW